MADEARGVEAALRTVNYPAWVVNWDYELESDADGVPAVWVNIFADDQTVPRDSSVGPPWNDHMDPPGVPGGQNRPVALCPPENSG